MRKRILGKGLDARRVVVIRDGAEIPAPGEPLRVLDAEVIQAIRQGFTFVLLHAGNLGFYGAWETLLEGARRLAGDGVGLVFVGDGAERARLVEAAAGIPNVRFLPFFPSSKIPSVLAAGDAHVITVKRSLEGVVVPSKLYDILVAGKPIIAVAPEDSDVVSLGKEKGFGVAADPESAEQLEIRVRELAGDGARRQRMGAAAAAAAAEYDRRRELAKLVKVLEEIGS
jgi:glycosyltransferase involved in cell wall biosynthesis